VLWIEELQSRDFTLFIHALETNVIDSTNFLQDSPSENQKHSVTFLTNFYDGFVFFNYKFF